MLDLYKLQIFALTAEAGSFSGAAERLLMSQPGVSQHMQELESQLGVRLFNRGRRGVSLTQAGEKLLSYAQRILALAAEAENAVTDVAHIKAGQMAVGATPGAGVYLLPEWIQAFRAQYPHLNVTLQTGITPEIVAQVRAHRLDIACIEGELDDLTAAQVIVQPLEQVEQQVVIGPGHAWWGRGRLSLAELDGQAFIMRQPNSHSRRWLEAALAQHGIQPRVNATFDNVESIKRAVMAGDCLAVLPGYAVAQEVDLGLMQAIPLEGAPLVRALKLVWAREGYLSPVARAFLAHLQGHFPALASLLPG